jgi:hypothetical protein
MPEFWRLVGKRPLPRIHLLSDIHLDTGPYAIPPELDYDVLVAAGDIGPVEQAVEWLASLDKPVVYVLGNHEYWGREYSDVLAAAKAAAKGTKVHVLEKNSVVIQGVRFLGATLWTDYGAWHPDLVRKAGWRMRDYSLITAHQWFGPKANQVWFKHYCLRAGFAPDFILKAISEGRFHPAIAYQLHQRSLAWLTRTLRKQFAGPTVVVTHHAPTFESLRAFGVREHLLQPENWGHREDSLVRVAAYASRLDNVLKHHSDVIDLWIHGHLHSGIDVLTQGVRVVCNPRGYAEKPLDAKSARAFGFFGHLVTPEYIERSQAIHHEQPYLGDAPNFDTSLVIDLETGFEKPVRREVEAPLVALRDLTQDAVELVSSLRRTRGPNRQYLLRCLDQDLQTFNATLDTFLARIRPSLAKYAWEQFDEPVRPWRPFQDDIDDLPAFYSRAIACMKDWDAWLQNLPCLVQLRLIEWARVSRAILIMLTEAGVEAWVERRPTTALRRLDALKHRVVVELSEELSEEWEARLDKTFSGGIPRKHVIWMWDLSDIPRDKRAGLLTLKELDEFFRQAESDCCPRDADATLLARSKTIKSILNEGEWLTAEQLHALQANPPAQKSKPASNWKRRGRIFGVNYDGQEYFARYQFDEAYQPLPVIQDVLRVFGDVVDTWEIAAWFNFPNGWISKPGTSGQEPQAPKDALDQRDALLRAVTARKGSYVA